VRTWLRTVRVIAAAAGLAGMATACTGSAAEGKSPAAAASHRPAANSLSAALGTAVRAGKGYSVSDATSLDRRADRTAPKRWKVCFKKDNADAQAVDFGVVLNKETCPKTWGARVPTPKTPRLTGSEFTDAYEKVLRLGYPETDIHVFYGGRTEVDRKQLDRVKGEVCTQYPKAGAAFRNPDRVNLYVAEGQCPRAS
jgi:hypothetical protein